MTQLCLNRAGVPTDRSGPARRGCLRCPGRRLSSRPSGWASARSGDGRLLTSEGFGHSTAANADPCINNAVAGYLVTGTLPAKGTICPAPAPLA
ncbi:MAG: alpha/beta hydrolase [Actinobacteria bacterium]|nr:alpha/beta hydrolase [Actinomycetota bacterium]